MTTLTEAKRAFCAEVAKGRTYVDAYRTAWPKSRASAATVSTNATRLMRRVDIQMYVTQLEEAAREVAVAELALTKRDIIRELWENAQIAKAAVPVLDRKGNPTGEYATNIAASNSALVSIGREMGMFKDGKPEHDDELAQLTREQVKALVNLGEKLVDPRNDDPDSAGASLSRPAGKRAPRRTH